MEELALHILDIAQNSITAKATLVTIEISLRDGIITVTIKDDGCGMPDELVKRVMDPFVTSRTTRKVGLGLPMWKQLAEGCGGGFELSSRPNEGTAVTAWFEEGHIDLPPMGGVPETVSALIMCNPDIDFYYRRVSGTREFVLDTRELRVILGDVPLNSADVAVWVKEYIEENEKEIMMEVI